MSKVTHIVAALLEDDFDPTAEVDRLAPDWSKVRLVPHERSTVTNPSFHVWHPWAEWHLGTVQYAPMDGHGGDVNPWAGNPEGVNNDVRWFPTKDMAMRYVASFANIRESDEKDFAMWALPDRPMYYAQLKPGTLLYDEDAWRVEVIVDFEHKDWAADGPGLYVNYTEYSPALAYGRYESKRRRKNEPLPACVQIIGSVKDLGDPWEVLARINKERDGQS